MKGLDYYFDGLLDEYLNQPEEPEPVPCVYCGADCDENDDCTNPDCPNE